MSEVNAEQRAECLRMLADPKVYNDEWARTALLRSAGLQEATRPVEAAPAVRREDPLYEGLPEPKAPLGATYSAWSGRVWGS